MANPSRPIQLPSSRWRIRWLDAGGRRQSAVLDTHNEARAALARHQTDAEAVRIGERPAPPPRRTFEDLTVHWLATRAVRKRSRKYDECMLRVHLTPAFGGLALAEITYERVEAFKAARAHYASQTLRHHLNLLGAMLKHAHRLGWVLRVPPIDKPSVRLNSRDYSYLRTPEEVQRFLRAARDEGDDAFTLYATAVFTGLRQGELAALTWDRVEFDRRLITVDRSFHGPTKADDVRHVPVLAPLLPILRAWRLRCPGTLVFPTAKGDMHRPCDRIFVERFHRVLTAAGFVKPPMERRQCHYIRFHDMRHTFASHWMMAGGDLFKLQKILGHKSTELTLRYAHLSPDAFASYFARFNALAVGADADVFPLRGRRVSGHVQQPPRPSMRAGQRAAPTGRCSPVPCVGGRHVWADLALQRRAVEVAGVGHCAGGARTLGLVRSAAAARSGAGGPQRITAARIERVDAGNIRINLKNEWRGGVTAVLVTPRDLLIRALAQIPLSGRPSIRYYGCFAPNAADRKHVVPAGAKPKCRRKPTAATSSRKVRARRRRLMWRG
ncbi:MAG: site-specific integrase, partial [Myxococcales bacterium]|nr:site-specific integrase [Myxococcales bacterium]